MKPLTTLPDGNFWVVEIDNNRADVTQANNRWDKQLLSQLLKDGCVYLNRPDAQAHANKVNKKESFTLNEAFVGVQLSASDAKKIAAVTKAADIDLKGLAEDVYGQLEDELLSVDEVLAMIKSPDADDMEDWSLDKAGYQKALKQALSVALNEYQQDSKGESKVKSPACKKVLQLMMDDDTDSPFVSYSSALKKVLNEFPDVDRKALEKELDYWI